MHSKQYFEERIAGLNRNRQYVGRKTVRHGRNMFFTFSGLTEGYKVYRSPDKDSSGFVVTKEPWRYARSLEEVKDGVIKSVPDGAFSAFDIGDGNYYANPAITRAGKEYTLKFSFEGYGSSYSDLVFVSNLGNGNEDGSEWLGTFMSLESVEANFTKDIKAEVYYQISCVNVSKEMENIKDGILFGSTTGDWKKLDADTEVSKVKAIQWPLIRVNRRCFLTRFI